MTPEDKYKNKIKRTIKAWSLIILIIIVSILFVISIR